MQSLISSRLKPARWLNPEQSAGDLVRVEGRYIWWQAIGDVATKFVEAYEEIRTYAAKYGAPTEHFVDWSVYMFGHTKETSQPTIFFFCDTPKCKMECRKQVKRTVQEGGIMKKYPGFRLDDCSRPPDFEQRPCQLANPDLDPIAFDDTMKYDEGLNPPGYFFGLEGYRHSRLAPVKIGSLFEEEIRLLIIEPGQPADILTTRIKHTWNYRDLDYMAYSFLSQNDTQKVAIKVDSEVYKVPVTLVTFLKTLRSVNDECSIWVDVLCLDPDNDKELKRPYISISMTALYEETTSDVLTKNISTVKMSTSIYPSDEQPNTGPEPLISTASAIETSSGNVSFHMDNIPVPVLGLQARVHQSRVSGPPRPIGTITLGGIVEIKREFFCLTAAHTFSTSNPSETATSDETDDFEWSGHGDDLIDEEGLASAEATSRGSASPEPKEYNSSDDTVDSLEAPSVTPTAPEHAAPDIPLPNQPNTLEGDVGLTPQLPMFVPGLTPASERVYGTSAESSGTSMLPVPTSNYEEIREVIGFLAMSSLDGPRTALDYALIKIRPSQIRRHSLIPLDNSTHSNLKKEVTKHVASSRPYKNRNVVAVVGSVGVLRGTLSCTPTFGQIPFLSPLTFRELWTVRFKGSLVIGDSGSWVFDEDTGDLFGQIVSGSPETGVAYIVPAKDIFEDISERSRFDVRLLLRSDPLFAREEKPNLVSGADDLKNEPEAGGPEIRRPKSLQRLPLQRDNANPIPRSQRPSRVGVQKSHERPKSSLVETSSSDLDQTPERAGSKKYTYSALRGEEAIRIFRLFGGKEKDPIQGMLIPSKKNAAYETLTCLWGPEKAEHAVTLWDYSPYTASPSLISSAEKAGSLFIRKNLLSALQALRDPDQDIDLWIDAICIDNSNGIELSQQVPQIAEIYRNARIVLVWLGIRDEEASKEAGSAFQFARELCNLFTVDDKITDDFTNSWWILAKTMKSTIFSRRWTIQEIALGQEVILCSGNDRLNWDDFVDAVSMFVSKFDLISALPSWKSLMQQKSEPFSDISKLPVSILIDVLGRLTQKDRNGNIVEYLMSLEELVTTMTPFQTADSRDNVYALLSLAKDTDRSLTTSFAAYSGEKARSLWSENVSEITRKSVKDIISKALAIIGEETGREALAYNDHVRFSDLSFSQSSKRSITTRFRRELDFEIPNELFDAKIDEFETIGGMKLYLENKMILKSTSPFHLVVPDYTKTIDEVCVDFVKSSIQNSKSLGIICRHWAPHIESLPSWVPCATYGAFGRPWSLSTERSFGDSLVGPPGMQIYDSSAGLTITRDAVCFVRHELLNMSLTGCGIIIGHVAEAGPRCVRATILEESLKLGGWVHTRGLDNLNKQPIVPDELLQTLVAGRGPNGQKTPPWYQRAFEHVLSLADTGSAVDIDTNHLIETCSSSGIREFLERVRDVVWNRSLFTTRDPLLPRSGDRAALGIGPPDMRPGDKVCILVGCSVPVILRTVEYGAHKLVGECYLHGYMDGEAIRSLGPKPWEKPLKVFTLI